MNSRKSTNSKQGCHELRRTLPAMKDEIEEILSSCAKHAQNHRSPHAENIVTKPYLDGIQ